MSELPAPLFGVETEYGLFVADVEPSELIDASRAVVQAMSAPYVSAWDYRREDPRKDQRGFRVSRLARDPRDAQFDKPTDACRTTAETHSDRVLPNGARLYNDHGHPEYSTAECATLADLLAQHRAGDDIVLACARGQYGDRSVAIYKNNTDFSGASYGAHENYLVPREVPFERLVVGLMPFLVTRQVYAGAGKVGVEEDKGDKETRFQLSQRADFCTVDVSVDTLHRRPIVNTRDEPHADPREFRRLHVIVGDSNMSDYAAALKVGTTLAVLDLCSRQAAPEIELADPVAAIKQVSRDPSWEWIIKTKDRGTISALEVQGLYLEAAKAAEGDGDPDRAWVLREWESALSGLEQDPMTLSDRLDWVAKRGLLETFIGAEGLDWQDAALQSLDLEYHNVDPEVGLARRLESQGALARLADDAAVEAARTTPPANTRAAVRGACVARWPEQVKSVCWSRVEFNGDSDSAISLDELVGMRLDGLGATVAAAATPAELKSELGGASDA